MDSPGDDLQDLMELIEAGGDEFHDLGDNGLLVDFIFVHQFVVICRVFA